MDKHVKPRERHVYGPRTNELWLLRVREHARIRDSRDLFTQQRIRFYEHSEGVFLVTIGKELFDYNAKTGQWRPCSKWKKSSSPQAFLDSVRKDA